MADSNHPSANIQYDPLPLSHDDGGHDQLYNHESPAAFASPMMEPTDLPTGAVQPRFMGRALYDEPSTAPSRRESYAGTINNDQNSSVYALNPEAGSPYRDDPRDSYYAGSNQDLPMSPVGQSNRYMEEKRATYTAPRQKATRKALIMAAIGGLILLILAIVIPLYFTVFKPKHGAASSNTGGSSSGGGSQGSPGKPGKTSANVVTGGDGSTVTMDDGTTFTYSNSFGGTWYFDPQNPLQYSGQANSWTSPLNQTFNYGTDRIYGVNLGGWLTIEPFISPSLFEKYLTQTTPPVDEWTLSLAMAADTAGGGLSQLENHYKTFITEQDFAQIAGAGLNHVRIPLPYWAIETRDNEPFLAKTAWTYFLKAIEWARKYGIRINLDFHALPGSQNGWNHSGRLGTVNVLNGPMGLANAQRSLDYIRILAEFISQPQYSSVVTYFGITNEPQATTVGQDALSRYYLQAYSLIRAVTGTGQGNGPFISYHDGFLGLTEWAGFMPGADRIAMDLHPYLCFDAQSSAAIGTYKNTPCTAWGAMLNTSMTAFGLSAAGEWSNAVTDCGLWVNGVNLGQRYDGTYAGGGASVGNCTVWTNWQAYDAGTKNDIQNFALSSMDALQNWFFWTWKIGNSSVSGVVESPAWSYQLGLQNGWMPKDPRAASGACSNISPWTPPLQPYQTGGAGAGQIAAAVLASLAWPPPTISGGGAAAALPTYTPTGQVPTLPVPTFTGTNSAQPTSFNVGNGWADASDTAGLMVAIASCSYLDPWIGSAAPPNPLCSGGAVIAPAAVPTVATVAAAGAGAAGAGAAGAGAGAAGAGAGAAGAGAAAAAAVTARANAADPNAKGANNIEIPPPLITPPPRRSLN